MGIEYTEGNGARDFVGMVIEIEHIDATDKYGAQYKLIIKPKDEGMKLQYSWIGIPATATATSVPKKSLLGFVIKRLEKFGVQEDKVNDCVHFMEGKYFKFRDELPMFEGEAVTKKEKLLPYELVEEGGI